MKKWLTIICFFCSNQLWSQELFTYAEPASTRAAKSIGLRLTNGVMMDALSKDNYYHLQPEIFWGISKRITLSTSVFLNSSQRPFNAKGASLYFKYRFFSADEVHSHFRLAAFARGSYSNGIIHHSDLDLMGHNSGYETGLIATRLSKKMAVSATAGILYAEDNGNGNKFLYGNKSRNAFGYSVSAGKLMLPVLYTDYKQTNLNLMAELLGQVNLSSGKSYLDVAPSVQLIFLSKIRLDIGYRFELITDLKKSATGGFLLRFEYNIFNAYK